MTKKKLEKEYKIAGNNTWWLICEKAVRSIMTIFVGAAVIRTLGPDQYGKLAYVVSIVAFFQAVASLGIDGILIREIIELQNKAKLVTNAAADKLNHCLNIKGKVSLNEYPPKVAELITVAIALRAIFGLILLIVCVLTVGIIKEKSDEYLWIGVLVGSSLIFQSGEVVDIWNQSQLKSKKTVQIKITCYLISNLYRIYLLHIDANLLSFAFATFIEIFLIAAALIIQQKMNYYFLLRIKNLQKIASKFIRETWPLMTSALLAVVYTKFDQLTLEKYHGVSQFGIYNASIMLATATYFLPGILCASMMPIVTQAKSRSHNEYIKKLRITYIILAMIATLVCGLTYSMSHIIINLLYGEKYTDSSLILSIYSIVNIPVYMGVAHGIWMVNDRKLNISLYRAAAGALSAIFLSLTLIPEFGIQGAAISVLLASIVSDLIVPVILNKNLFKEIIGLHVISSKN